MDFRLHPRASLFITLWLCLPGAVLCPFIFWQTVTGGAVFSVIWAAAAAVLGFSWGRTLRGSARAGVLTVCVGILFKFTWRLPLRYVTGITRLETPLMQLSGTCALVVHTSGRALLLPAISEAAAIQLAALLQREAGL